MISKKLTKKIIFPIIIIILTSCSQTPSPNLIISPKKDTKINYPNPKKRHSIINSISGENIFENQAKINLKSDPKEIIILNIWAQWCALCRIEAPTLENLYQKNKHQPIKIIGINIRDNRKAAQDFIQDHGLSYPSIYDPNGRTLTKLIEIPITVVPATIIIDKNFRVTTIFLRAIEEDDIQPIITQLLHENVK